MSLPYSFATIAIAFKGGVAELVTSAADEEIRSYEGFSI